MRNLEYWLWTGTAPALTLTPLEWDEEEQSEVDFDKGGKKNIMMMENNAMMVDNNSRENQDDFANTNATPAIIIEKQEESPGQSEGTLPGLQISE